MSFKETYNHALAEKRKNEFIQRSKNKNSNPFPEPECVNHVVFNTTPCYINSNGIINKNIEPIFVTMYPNYSNISVRNEPCSICRSLVHTVDNCPLICPYCECRNIKHDEMDCKMNELHRCRYCNTIDMSHNCKTCDSRPKK